MNMKIMTRFLFFYTSILSFQLGRCDCVRFTTFIVCMILLVLLHIIIVIIIILVLFHFISSNFINENTSWTGKKIERGNGPLDHSILMGLRPAKPNISKHICIHTNFCCCFLFFFCLRTSFTHVSLSGALCTFSF